MKILFQIYYSTMANDKDKKERTGNSMMKFQKQQRYMNKLKKAELKLKKQRKDRLRVTPS